MQHAMHLVVTKGNGETGGDRGWGHTWEQLCICGWFLCWHRYSINMEVGAGNRCGWVEIGADGLKQVKLGLKQGWLVENRCGWVMAPQYTQIIKISRNKCTNDHTCVSVLNGSREGKLRTYSRKAHMNYTCVCCWSRWVSCAQVNKNKRQLRHSQGFPKWVARTDRDQTTNSRPKKTEATDCSRFESPVHVTQPQRVNNTKAEPLIFKPTPL